MEIQSVSSLEFSCIWLSATWDTLSQIFFIPITWLHVMEQIEWFSEKLYNELKRISNRPNFILYSMKDSSSSSLLTTSHQLAACQDWLAWNTAQLAACWHSSGCLVLMFLAEHGGHSLVGVAELMIFRVWGISVMSMMKFVIMKHWQSNLAYLKCSSDGLPLWGLLVILVMLTANVGKPPKAKHNPPVPLSTSYAWDQNPHQMRVKVPKSLFTVIYNRNKRTSNNQLRLQCNHCSLM